MLFNAFKKIYGVQILIQFNDKFLILKRSLTDRKAPGQWNLPGGKFEPNEIWYHTAKRELLEEAGISINDFILLESSFRPFIKNQFINFAFQSHLVYASVGDTNIKLNEEHSEYKWITIDEFEKYNVLCYSSEEIKKYLEKI